MKTTYHPGQRWISDTEPELGLGSVAAVTRLTVSLIFGASGEKREYARDNAPLRRVRFHAGDMVTDREGRSLAVLSVDQRHGLLYYRGAEGELCETSLLDATSFNRPEERLLVGQVDGPGLFALRLEALKHQHERRRSGARGFVGGRIDLIPHQLYIAAEVSARLSPRVLLADEVGLGKTIEACLILHRLLLTGRASRVLVLSPDSLVHQWLVEMQRRFSVWLHIFDERRCAAIEAARPGANPFLEDQLILASLRLFTGNERRVAQAAAAGWDVVVVDEAHHLGWTPQTVSPEYAAVEALSRAAPGLLLLTATPEQLGRASHFARLRLLDPARFHDLSEFVRETAAYRSVAAKAATVRDPQALARLLDEHGTGRVVLRNTRATIRGFPEREVLLCPLNPVPGSALLSSLAREFQQDLAQDPAYRPDFAGDPRIDWLVDLLKALGREKVLLLCRSRAKAEAIEEAIRPRFNVKMAVFHEGLSLVQRDRHAAWFAEEDGARLLIASEIGSEGRNFQFAHHLVLFDLPIEPELLEQRIGRLDRIGQTSRIHLHVPYARGSAQEVLVGWYERGLDSFRKNLHGGHELRERFGPRIQDLASTFHEMDAVEARDALRRVIDETMSAREELALTLEDGRDRLLELSSFRADVAAGLVEEIRARDDDRTLDAFMISVFDHFAVPVEEIAPRTYRLGSSGVLADGFPGLPLSGLTVTCDRKRALSREDIAFLTWDHPLVTGALDLILGSERGNSSFAWWPDSQKEALYVEAIYLLECVAPTSLHIDRFLPPLPLRVLLDHEGSDQTATIAPDHLCRVLERGDSLALEQPEIRQDLLPAMLRKTYEIASARVPHIVDAARSEMAARLDPEILRLRELRKMNPSVRAEEIDWLADQKASLDRHLLAARLRLDAIRLIQRGPMGGSHP